MEYKRLGNSDLKVSSIALGTWAIGGDFWGKSEDDAAVASIRKAIDSGINIIDTAPRYGWGHSEELVGKAVKGIRKDVIIATKCGLRRVEGSDDEYRNLTAESIMEEIDLSLSRLGTDYIDLYQIHWHDGVTPVEEIFETLLKIQKSGKVRYLGVTNFDTELLSRSIKAGGIISLQSQYSLLYRENEKNIAFSGENGLGVIGYGALSGGMLSGKYKKDSNLAADDRRALFYGAFRDAAKAKSMDFVEELRVIAENIGKPMSQVAINWVRQQSAVTTALVGARTAEQAADNAGAGDWDLTAETIDAINKAYAKIFG